MSLFRRLFGSKAELPRRETHQELVETVGLLLLSARERGDDSLRHSARLGELLGLLWQENSQALDAVHNALNSVEKIDRDFLVMLAGRVRAVQPVLPPAPEARYAAVVQALRAELERLSALAADRSFSATPPRFAVDLLTLTRILLPAELHAPVCAFLVVYSRLQSAEGEESVALPYQELVLENIYRYLAAIPPQEATVFWEMLRDPEVSREFWPALRRIRDRNAVPLLLGLLPPTEAEEGVSPLSIPGQTEVIRTLREIGDLRAVPVLQAMEKRLLPPPEERPGIQTTWDRALAKAWRERNELARVAGQAARHILRESGEPDAQRLRPTSLPTPPPDVRLRPSPPATGPPPAAEKMRRSERPERPKRTL